MNLKMSFLATLSVALFAFSANAEIIHESDFEAEPTVGFGVGSETMIFNDAGGDMIGFSANGNSLDTGDSVGISDSNPNSGSFSYVNDVGATTDEGGQGPPTGNGWGAAWCGANTESGTGGFTDQATAVANGDGCYVDFSEGATFTATCQIATDPANPLTGNATGEIRLEFTGTDANGVQVDNSLVRRLSPRLGVADLTDTYQPITVSYTLTAQDIADSIAGGTEDGNGNIAAPSPNGITRVSAVMAIEGAGHGTSTGHILFDDFVFEVDSAHVVVVGNGHATVGPVLKGDVDLNGTVNFLDINSFINVLSANGFQLEADCDCDEDVDFLDIVAFIEILAAS